MTNNNNYVATAFISCSLRPEDMPFIEYVARILKAYKMKPVGTVGKFYAAPENPAVSMKRNISNYDFLVIIATPRYFEKDIQTRKTKLSISEQLHVEAGIADGLNKPIIAFVQKGTDVGNFIPQVTQYIMLDGTAEDYNNKKRLIFSLLNNTYKRVQELKGDKTIKSIRNVIVNGLAIYGTIKLIDFIIKKN